MSVSASDVLGLVFDLVRDLDAARREVAELRDDKARLETSVNNLSAEVDLLREDLSGAVGELELVRSGCSCGAA